MYYVWFWSFLCGCAYLCDISVECFEDQDTYESERKYRGVGLFEDVVFSYMMSDVRIDST